MQSTVYNRKVQSTVFYDFHNTSNLKVPATGSKRKTSGSHCSLIAMNARNAILTLFFQKKRSFHRFYVCLLSIFVKPHHYKLFLIPLALEFRPLCSLQFPTWNIKKELERSFIILPPPLSSQQESVLQCLVVSLEFFLSSCLRRYRHTG